MKDSKIEWTDHTFNTHRGCTKVSAGCANCYAETLSGRNPAVLGIWGPNGTRVVAAESAWREPLKWNREAVEAGERHRVFCASLADVFEDWKGPMLNSHGDELFSDRIGGWSDRVGDKDGHRLKLTMQDVRTRLYKLIDATPNLDWLLLTKRPENIRRMMPLFRSPGEKRVVESWPRNKNVWLGTSIENRSVLHRIDALRSNPAVVRFLSIEPLLEDLGTIDLTGIHWVIVGGESGRGARPCDLAWIRSIRDQCRAAGVPVFVKQLGANPSATLAESGTDPGDDDNIERLKLSDKKGGDWEEWPSDLRVREFPKGGAS